MRAVDWVYILRNINVDDLVFDFNFGQPARPTASVKGYQTELVRSSYSNIMCVYEAFIGIARSVCSIIAIRSPDHSARLFGAEVQK